MNVVSSDPFLELWKVFETGEYGIVHRTEVIKWNVNPQWKHFTLPVQTLCNGDYDRDILIKCYDWNRSGNHSFIGKQSCASYITRLTFISPCYIS